MLLLLFIAWSDLRLLYQHHPEWSNVCLSDLQRLHFPTDNILPAAALGVQQVRRLPAGSRSSIELVYRVSVSLTTHSADSTLTSLDTQLAEACNEAEDAIIAARPPKKQINGTDNASPISQLNSSAKAVKQENDG